MRRIISVLTVAALMAAMLVASAGNALAEANNPHGFFAPGQSNAFDNCGDTFLRLRDAKGVTGNQTGSPQDEKQLPDPVSNCDHYWQNEGSNP